MAVSAAISKIRGRGNTWNTRSIKCHLGLLSRFNQVRINDFTRLGVWVKLKEVCVHYVMNLWPTFFVESVNRRFGFSARMFWEILLLSCRKYLLKFDFMAVKCGKILKNQLRSRISKKLSVMILQSASFDFSFFPQATNCVTFEHWKFSGKREWWVFNNLSRVLWFLTSTWHPQPKFEYFNDVVSQQPMEMSV